MQLIIAQINNRDMIADSRLTQLLSERCCLRSRLMMTRGDQPKRVKL
ncbi:hypothetical protein APA_3624 [Pseudanabaena sp. lw0831]|nr:hypothetical protein APA_3624 [Pseudanabaena sp. lw0831]